MNEGLTFEQRLDLRKELLLDILGQEYYGREIESLDPTSTYKLLRETMLLQNASRLEKIFYKNDKPTEEKVGVYINKAREDVGFQQKVGKGKRYIEEEFPADVISFLILYRESLGSSADPLALQEIDTMISWTLHDELYALDGLIKNNDTVGIIEFYTRLRNAGIDSVENLLRFAGVRSESLRDLNKSVVDLELKRKEYQQTVVPGNWRIVSYKRMGEIWAKIPKDIFLWGGYCGKDSRLQQFPSGHILLYTGFSSQASPLVYSEGGEYRLASLLSTSNTDAIRYGLLEAGLYYHISLSELFQSYPFLAMPRFTYRPFLRDTLENKMSIRRGDIDIRNSESEVYAGLALKFIRELDGLMKLSKDEDIETELEALLIQLRDAFGYTEALPEMKPLRYIRDHNWFTNHNPIFEMMSFLFPKPNATKR